MKTIILMTISLLICSCAGRTAYRPFKGASYICKNPLKHQGCKKGGGTYDNTDLHAHDPRELDSIKVPY